MTSAQPRQRQVTPATSVLYQWEGKRAASYRPLPIVEADRLVGEFADISFFAAEDSRR